MKGNIAAAVEGPTEGGWSCYLAGPTSSDRRLAVIGRLRYLLEKRIPGHQILLLVPDRSTGLEMRAELAAVQTEPFGPVDPQTYYSMAARFTRLFWPLLAADAGFSDPRQPPVLLNYEMAQHLLGQLIQPLLNKGYFEELSLRPQRIISQLIDNLNRAAVNGYPVAEVESRLTAAWSGEADRLRYYEQGQECIDLFRAHCLRYGLLDLSFSVSLFTQLCETKAFWSFLARRYRHLVAEQVEETVPVAQDMLRGLLGEADSTLLCCDPEGGYRSFLGSDPAGATALRDLCRKSVDLTAGTSPVKIVSFLNGVAGELQQAEAIAAADGEHVGFVGSVRTRYRVEMIRQIGAEISRLRRNGTAPGEIAVVAPIADGGLRFMLGQVLSEAGIAFKIVRRYENLFEEPIVRSAIAVAMVSHPVWGRKPTTYEIAEAFATLLKCDPIRGRLAANHLFDAPTGSLRSPANLDETVVLRLGERLLGAFDALRRWVDDCTSRPAEHIDHFLRRLFNEPFLQAGLASHDIEIFSKLVASAAAFRRTAPFLGLGIEEIGNGYTSMLAEGIVAAQYVADSSGVTEADAVTLIAPVYTYLLSHQRARVQFWLDIGSPYWWEPLHQPLTNHQILARSWSGDEKWTDLIDYRQRNRNLLRLLRGLVRRCDEGVYLCSSELDSGGNPQQGPLLFTAERVLEKPQ
jgi:hypothetical protein